MTSKIILDAEEFYLDDRWLLVICERTGIFYTAQVGGMSCAHPQAEGFLLPLWEDFIDIDAHDYGCSNLNKSARADLDRPDLRRILADAIDSALITACERFRFSIRFDYARIDELMESWLPVVVKGSFNASETELNHKAYVVTGNCD